jgi:hypothetical protein
VKRALLIVAVVAGYSFLEAVLLLGVIVPSQSGLLTMPTSYARFAGCGQFLLIPGLAVLFSRIIYGRRKLGRRALLALLIGPLAFYLFLSPFVALVLIFDWTFVASRIMLGIVAVILFVAMAAAFRWCIRRSRKWNTEAEAERWLAERHAGSVERKWRSRSIRLALCIPVTIVLLVFLFLPETWGVLSHIRHPRLGDLPGYRVKIPVIWIVQYRGEDSDGSSSVAGFFGRGIGSGFNPSRFDSFSYWRFSTSSFSGSETIDYGRWSSQEEDIIERRDVLIGGEHIQCVDYRYRWELDYSQRSSATAHVSCQGATRLRANFDGPRKVLPDFYRVLSEIKSR